MHVKKQTQDKSAKTSNKTGLLRTTLMVTGVALTLKAAVLGAGLYGQAVGLDNRQNLYLDTKLASVIPAATQPRQTQSQSQPPDRPRINPHPEVYVASKTVGAGDEPHSRRSDANTTSPVQEKTDSHAIAQAATSPVLAEHLAKMKLKLALLAAREANRKLQIAKAQTTPKDPVTANAAKPPPALTAVREETLEPAAQKPVVVASLGPSLPTSAIQPGNPVPVDQQVTLPRIDETVAEQVAAAPPVPALRPRPLIRSNPGTVSKPGAITKPTQDPKPRHTTKPARSSAPVMAYANPGDPEADSKSLFSGLGKVFKGQDGGLPGRGSKVAVYVIDEAVVYMPDGSKLEAHSGIGHRKDNPKYAYVKNLGPTPPNVYKLRMRERRFHGVEAIRMLPIDRAAMKGRDGMLAHTPLLRRTNGSHGCVAFKHYNKFLRAFKAGKVKTMVVVPSMNKLPTYMAKLNRSKGA